MSVQILESLTHKEKWLILPWGKKKLQLVTVWQIP